MKEINTSIKKRRSDDLIANNNSDNLPLKIASWIQNSDKNSHKRRICNNIANKGSPVKGEILTTIRGIS